MAKRARSRRKRKGWLFGEPLDRRRTLLWAAASLLLALAFAGWAQIPREAVDPAASRRLELWIPVGWLGSLALFFGLTALLLWLPERLRAKAQLAAALAVALLFFAILALPAKGLPSPGALTYDEWPLAVALFLFTWPSGWFMHRRYPLRAFVLGAAVPFVLILPDYVGLYIELTGETDIGPTTARSGLVVVVPESIWVYFTPEDAVQRRASGVFVTWYALLLLATWVPLGWLLLRRRRAAPVQA